jgi:hypothetical protein
MEKLAAMLVVGGGASYICVMLSTVIFYFNSVPPYWMDIALGTSILLAVIGGTPLMVLGLMRTHNLDRSAPD